MSVFCDWLQDTVDLLWLLDLVGGIPTPLNIWKSNGSSIPNIWKVIQLMFQTTNQMVTMVIIIRVLTPKPPKVGFFWRGWCCEPIGQMVSVILKSSNWGFLKMLYPCVSPSHYSYGRLPLVKMLLTGYKWYYTFSKWGYKYLKLANGLNCMVVLTRSHGHAWLGCVIWYPHDLGNLLIFPEKTSPGFRDGIAIGSTR